MKKIAKTMIVSLFVPIYAFARGTEVVNDISVSASTGNNRASSGQVVEGRFFAEIDVHTEINGEVVEDFYDSFEGEGEVELGFEKETENTKVRTEMKVGVQEKTFEEKNIFKKILNYVFSFFKFQ